MYNWFQKPSLTPGRCSMFLACTNDTDIISHVAISLRVKAHQASILHVPEHVLVRYKME